MHYKTKSVNNFKSYLENSVFHVTNLLVFFFKKSGVIPITLEMFLKILHIGEDCKTSVHKCKKDGLSTSTTA